MIKKGIYLVFFIFIIWLISTICQLWFSPLSSELFVKLSLTMGIIDIIILAILACIALIKQLNEEKQMKKDGLIR